MTTGQRDRFRARIAETLGVAPAQVTLFARGRVALYAILRAIDIRPGDEVILPAFTCVAVPNAVLYAGARPVWADIDPQTLCLDPAAAAAAVTSRTRVILAQNTFGLSADLDALAGVAASAGATLVDDCTHGLGGAYRGRPNGATAPLAFFSTQWSKPISTGLGGFAIARDAETADRLRDLEARADEPGQLRVLALQTLVRARELAGRGRIFRAGRAAYRTTSRLGLLPASSGRDELAGSAMPAGFLARLSESQAGLGSDRLATLSAQVAQRRLVAGQYSSWLAAHGRTAAAEPAYAEHAFLRYPLRTRDREGFRSAAELAGVDLGDWFVSPVHPVTEGLDRWGYLAGTAPAAEQACREIVNLPTDPALGPRGVEQVLSLLAAQVDLLA